MDPVSIIAGSATLAALCGQCILSITALVSDIKQIDTEIKGFCDELKTLEDSLKSLNWALNTKTMREVGRLANENGKNDLWDQISKSMTDTRNTLSKLERILRDINDTEGGLVRKPIKLFKANLQNGDIAVLRQRLVLLTSALHLPLQMLNIYMVAEKSTSDVQNHRMMVEKLDLLQQTVVQMQQSIRSHRNARRNTSPNLDDEPVYANASELMETAQGFASNASASSSLGLDTITSVTREGSARTSYPLRPPPKEIFSGNLRSRKGVPATWGRDSLLGEELSTERQLRIERWIPPPSLVHEVLEESDTLSSSHGSSSLPPQTEITSIPEFPDEPVRLHKNDLETQLLGARLVRGRALFEAGKFDQAEPLLRNSLEATRKPGFVCDAALTSDNLVLMLATIYAKTGKLKEAKQLLTPLYSGIGLSSQATPLEAFSAKHILAEIQLEEGRVKDAEALCLEVVRERHVALGKSSPAYHESVRLLCRIYRVMGNTGEAEVWQYLLPTHSHVEEFIQHCHEIDRLYHRGDKDEAVALGMEVLKEYMPSKNCEYPPGDPRPATQIPYEEGLAELAKNIASGQAAGLAGTGQGFAPLHYLAASSPPGTSSLECDGEIEYLLSCGANATATFKFQDQSNQKDKIFPRSPIGTPLMMAVLFNNCQTIKILFEHGCTLDPPDGVTPLHLAAMMGAIESVEILLELGANINTSAIYDGYTPLHVAAEGGRTHIVSVLLSKGANVAAKSLNGMTALHLAAICGHSACVRLLLAQGAEIEAKTPRGRTALYLAAKSKHKETVAELRSKGADVKILKGTKVSLPS